MSIPLHYFHTGAYVDRPLPFASVSLFGARGDAPRWVSYFTMRGIEVVSIVDNDPAEQGKSIRGVAVKAPNTLLRDGPETVYITTPFRPSGTMIAHQLLSMGIRNIFISTGHYSQKFEPSLRMEHGRELEAVETLLADEESRDILRSVVACLEHGWDGCLRLSTYGHYAHPAAAPPPGSTVLDLGAYVGETAKQFVEGYGAAVHALEPSAANYAAMERNIREWNVAGAVTPHNLGVWSASCELRFSSFADAPYASRAEEGGAETVRAVSVDDFLRSQAIDEVSLIKMDVEGAELEALKGATRTIRDHSPILCLSLYHALEDLWEIPLYLNAAHPGYTLFLGHHSTCLWETVLYAVP